MTKLIGGRAQRPSPTTKTYIHTVGERLPLPAYPIRRTLCDTIPLHFSLFTLHFSPSPVHALEECISRRAKRGYIAKANGFLYRACEASISRRHRRPKTPVPRKAPLVLKRARRVKETCRWYVFSQSGEQSVIATAVERKRD